MSKSEIITIRINKRNIIKTVSTEYGDASIIAVPSKKGYSFLLNNKYIKNYKENQNYVYSQLPRDYRLEISSLQNGKIDKISYLWKDLKFIYDKENDLLQKIDNIEALMKRFEKGAYNYIQDKYYIGLYLFNYAAIYYKGNLVYEFSVDNIQYFSTVVGELFDKHCWCFISRKILFDNMSGNEIEETLMILRDGALRNLYLDLINKGINAEVLISMIKYINEKSKVILLMQLLNDDTNYNFEQFCELMNRLFHLNVSTIQEMYEMYEIRFVEELEMNVKERGR